MSLTLENYYASVKQQIEQVYVRIYGSLRTTASIPSCSGIEDPRIPMQSKDYISKNISNTKVKGNVRIRIGIDF